ncbi:hypothetical protein KUTeg_015158 [Tegillarca granosa]|uniref:C-type lectin domain-containing protein n=1 Tax=Tegillarca granosa TaxID=220873 RepID=A0ABQ9EPD2_TEGGR|nr:hypothetical protein KUTeg_015158 [Tegillarca granosa]
MKRYVWVDGTGTDFTNWFRGEPNNVKDSEDCVEYSAYTNAWNDNNCYISRSFICKAPSVLTIDART